MSARSVIPKLQEFSFSFAIQISDPMITNGLIDYLDEADAKIIAYKLQYLANPDAELPKEYLKIVSAVDAVSIQAIHAFDLYQTSNWEAYYKNFPMPYKGQWFVEVTFLREEHWPDESKVVKQKGGWVCEEHGWIEDKLDHRRFCKIYTVPSTILDRWEKIPIKEVEALSLKHVDSY